MHLIASNAFPYPYRSYQNMITLEGIKAMLMIAGVHRLKIDFDDEQKHINAEYVFKGESGTKQITYQEIIDSLTIGQPEAPVGPGAVITQELT